MHVIDNKGNSFLAYEHRLFTSFIRSCWIKQHGQ